MQGKQRTTMTREAGEVRIHLLMLTLGVGAGVLVGLTLAPLRGADVRRLVARSLHALPALWGWSGRLTEELAEDLSS